MQETKVTVPQPFSESSKEWLLVIFLIAGLADSSAITASLTSLSLQESKNIEQRIIIKAKETSQKLHEIIRIKASLSMYLY
jgi:hypothetical protein